MNKIKSLFNSMSTKGKVFSLCVPFVAIAVAAAVLISGIGIAAPTLPHIDEIAYDLRTDDGTFTILELVASEADRSFGYYIDGQEPIVEGWEEDFMEAEDEAGREEIVHGLRDRLIDTGLLGGLDDDEDAYPMTWLGDYAERKPWEDPAPGDEDAIWRYFELGEFQEATIKGAMTPVLDKSGNFNAYYEFVPWDDHGENEFTGPFKLKNMQLTYDEDGEEGDTWYFNPTFIEVTLEAAGLFLGDGTTPVPMGTRIYRDIGEEEFWEIKEDEEDGESEGGGEGSEAPAPGEGDLESEGDGESEPGGESESGESESGEGESGESELGGDMEGMAVFAGESGEGSMTVFDEGDEEEDVGMTVLEGEEGGEEEGGEEGGEEGEGGMTVLAEEPDYSDTYVFHTILSPGTRLDEKYKYFVVLDYGDASASHDESEGYVYAVTNPKVSPERDPENPERVYDDFEKTTLAEQGGLVVEKNGLFARLPYLYVYYAAEGGDYLFTEDEEGGEEFTVLYDRIDYKGGLRNNNWFLRHVFDRDDNELADYGGRFIVKSLIADGSDEQNAAIEAAVAAGVDMIILSRNIQLDDSAAVEIYNTSIAYRDAQGALTRGLTPIMFDISLNQSGTDTLRRLTSHLATKTENRQVVSYPITSLDPIAPLAAARTSGVNDNIFWTNMFQSYGTGSSAFTPPTAFLHQFTGDISETNTAFATYPLLDFVDVRDEINFENFLRELQRLEDELKKEITVANSIRYIINFKGQRVENKWDTINVLEIQPGAVGEQSDLTEALVQYMIGSPIGRRPGVPDAVHVNITRMTTMEFVGKIEDLNETYHMIYIGGSAIRVNNSHSGTTWNNSDHHNGVGSGYTGIRYNDSSMNGLLYTNIGDRYRASTSDITTDGRGFGVDYVLSMLNDYPELDSNGYRLSGNDITQNKVDDILDFVAAGYPVIIDGRLLSNPESPSFAINPARVDNSSFMWQMLDEIKDAPNVFSRGNALSGNGERSNYNWADHHTNVGRYLNLSKPVIDLLDYPVRYTSVNDVETLGIRGSGSVLRYRFKIENITDATPTRTTYDVRLFVDVNSDGKYKDNEELRDITVREVGGSVLSRSGDVYHLYADREYEVRRTMPDSAVGLYAWNLRVVKNGSGGVVRGSVTDYTRIEPSSQYTVEASASGGATAGLRIEVTDSRGRTVAPSQMQVQWYRSTSGGAEFTTQTAVSANDAPAAAGEYYYRARVTVGGFTAYSRTLTVHRGSGWIVENSTPPSAVNQAYSISVTRARYTRNGTAYGGLRMEVSVTGPDGAAINTGNSDITYQWWHRNSNTGTGANALPANDWTFDNEYESYPRTSPTIEANLPGATGNRVYEFRCLVTINGVSQYSPWIRATHNSAGGTVNGTAWQIDGTTPTGGVVNGVFATGTGASNLSATTTLTVPYTRTVTANASGSANPSLQVNVTGPPLAGSGSTTPTPTPASAITSYQWQRSANGTSGWENIAGATSRTLTDTATTSGTQYYRVSVSVHGGAVTDSYSHVVRAAQGDGFSTAPPLSSAMGEDTSQQINILQIASSATASFAASTKFDLEAQLEPIGAVANQQLRANSGTYYRGIYGKLLADVEDFNVNIITVRATDMDNLNIARYRGTATAAPERPKLQEHLLRNGVVLSELSFSNDANIRNSLERIFETFDMLIIGFDDCWGELSASGSRAIVEYIDSGKSILFTHDTTSFFVNDNSETRRNLTGSYFPWGYQFNRYLRDAVRLDRYGISRVIGSGTQVGEYDDLALALRGWTTTQTAVPSLVRSLLEEGYSIAYNPAVAAGSRTQVTRDSQGFTNYILKRYASSTNTYRSFLGTNEGTSDSYTRTTAVSQVNAGKITTYPYNINIFDTDNHHIEGDTSGGTTMQVANTHFQYFQINLNSEDIVVWYCLRGNNANDSFYAYNDVVNGYYVYNAGNITYSGAGHVAEQSDYTSTSSGGIASRHINEAMLFVNTMIAAFRATPRAPEVLVVDENSVEVAYRLLSADGGGDDAILSTEVGVSGDLKVFFQVNDGNIADWKNITLNLSYRPGNHRVAPSSLIDDRLRGDDVGAVALPHAYLQDDVGGRDNVNVYNSDRRDILGIQPGVIHWFTIPEEVIELLKGSDENASVTLRIEAVTRVENRGVPQTLHGYADLIIRRVELFPLS